MIEANALRKSYETGKTPLLVLDQVSFRCEKGEIASVVGPTGCGKTTLLNVMARLDLPDGGSATVEGKVGYMMQDALLLPWRTLAQNGILGAEVTRTETRDSHILLDKYLDAFDLARFSDSYPQAASGGMKQRVALIRTLLTQPSALLLVEPFSNLDFDVQLKIQRFLMDYHQKHSVTTLLVTHDIEDAIALSDKVIVLSSRPATVKTVLRIDLGRDPIRARKSPRFTEYFARIWDEIKYLED